jgi:hypothetical protein
MQYIDYFEWILNSDFLQKGNDALTLIEPAVGENKEQRVVVKSASNSISSMKLYRFNNLEEDGKVLFPYFNQRTVEPEAPHGLNSFCDYILLVQHVKGLFVFFLEMKRGRHDDADKQIEASSVFFDYIMQSAERIKVENGFQDFDPQQVRYRKIVINNATSNKRITKDKDIEDLDLNSVIIHKCQSEFRPVGYCK